MGLTEISPSVGGTRTRAKERRAAEKCRSLLRGPMRRAGRGAPPWVRPWRSLELSRAATETDAMLRSPFAGPSGPHTRKHARGLEYFAEADHAGTASQSAGPPAPFSSPPSSSKPVYLPPFVVAVEEEEERSLSPVRGCPAGQWKQGAEAGRRALHAEAKAGLGLQQSQGQDLVDQLVNDAPQREARYGSLLPLPLPPGALR